MRWSVVGRDSATPAPNSHRQLYGAAHERRLRERLLRRRPRWDEALRAGPGRPPTAQIREVTHKSVTAWDVGSRLPGPRNLIVNVQRHGGGPLAAYPGQSRAGFLNLRV